MLTQEHAPEPRPPWPDRPMSDRSLRVAMTGFVHDDDPTIIADMQQEIERLRDELERVRRELRIVARYWQITDAGRAALASMAQRP